MLQNITILSFNKGLIFRLFLSIGRLFVNLGDKISQSFDHTFNKSVQPFVIKKNLVHSENRISPHFYKFVILINRTLSTITMKYDDGSSNE